MTRRRCRRSRLHAAPPDLGQIDAVYRDPWATASEQASTPRPGQPYSGEWPVHRRQGASTPRVWLHNITATGVDGPSSKVPTAQRAAGDRPF